MSKVAAVGLITAAVMATAGCSRRGDNDPGPTVSRNYQVPSFDQIEVAGPYDVTVHSGGNIAVSASGSQKLLDRTIVEVKGGKLAIHPAESTGFTFFSNGSPASARFMVTVPQISGAATAGSGNIHIDRVDGANFSARVGGAGGIDLRHVSVRSINLSIGGGGDIKAGTGKAQDAAYAVGGSGNIDAGGVETEKASISIAGSGSVAAKATKTADVNIAGSGSVAVTGGAKCTLRKAGSGVVSCP